MNFRFLRHPLVVFLGCILSSCSYTPEEDFYKEIKVIDPNDFIISLDSNNTEDTIYLEGPMQFSYSIGNGNGDVKEVRILLNNSLIKSLRGKSGSFIISPTETGIYELRIEFVSTSGSGSLADQVGAEIVQVWKSWTIKAYIETPPLAPKITTSIVNGYSVITWTPYTKTKFVNYRIEIKDLVSVYITDPQITTLIDSSYAGVHNRTYRVYTQNEAGITGSNEIELIGFNNLAIQASFNSVDSTIKVKVPKPIYYGAFQSYSIKEDEVEIGQLTNPNQEEFVFKASKVGLNYTLNISVLFNPKRPASTSAYGYAQLKTSIPTQKFSRTIQQFTYSNELNSIIGFWGSGNEGELFKIDPSTFAITDSMEIFNGPGYYIPYNGLFAYYSNPSQLTQLNLITHEEKSINAITTTYGSGPSLITASEQQIVSYSWFGPGDRITYYGRVYDMASNQTIWQMSRSNASIPYTISDDGQFVRDIDNKIYKIANGSLSLVGTLSFSGSWLGFRKDLCEEILIQSGNTIRIYDANSLTMKRVMSVSHPSSAFVTYDVATKNLIFNNLVGRKLYSVNIDTGSTKEFNVYLWGYSFINGTIIMNSKDYLKLF